VSPMILAATDAFSAPRIEIQMIALGLLLLGAHLGGKLCQRLGLSDVTGQLVGGAAVGPYALQLAGIIPENGSLYADAIHTFRFFIFVFLSVVAFGIGEELYWKRLRKVGLGPVIICLVQAAATWVCTTTAFLAFSRFSTVESLLIGSIGIATAPAVTFVIMNKLRIEGRLRHIVGSLVVLADLVEIIVFSVFMQIALRKTENSHGSLVLPVLKELGEALLIGALVYLSLRILIRRRAAKIETAGAEPGSEGNFLHRILAERPSPSAEILIIVFGVVALGTGFSYLNHLPFLITAIFSGFLVANFHSHAIFDSLKLEHLAPVFNLVFFALIGAGVSLSDLGAEEATLVGLYIAARMVGKLGGTWLGCKIMREDRKVTACLPRLMLPQAGVAAVEAVFVSTILGKPEVSAVIVPAIVFFEIFGVFMVDGALRKWASWVAEEEEAMKPKTRAPTALAESAERIIRYLSPQGIRLDLKGADKNEVMEELLDLAIQVSPEHIDRDQALQVLGERERLAPTGLGEGVAIPHCRLLGLEKPVIVFGRHEKGVVFGGIDDNPCTLILMILSSARKPGSHLRLLSAAAHLFVNEETRERFRTVGSAEELIEFLRTLS